MNITLPRNIESIINDQIASGVYSNASEVITKAIEKCFTRQDDLTLSQAQIEEIQEESRKLNEELANGTAIIQDVDEVFSRLDKKFS
jgi:putative addiction module CopG family antidote